MSFKEVAMEAEGFFNGLFDGLTKDQTIIMSGVGGVIVVSILLYCLIDLIAACLRFLVVLMAFLSIAVGVALYFALEPPAPITIQDIEAQGGKGFALSDGRYANYEMLLKTLIFHNRLVEYFDIGPQNGKPLVLIHAHSMSGYFFVSLQDFATSRKLRIIAPSLPGW